MEHKEGKSSKRLRGLAASASPSTGVKGSTTSPSSSHAAPASPPAAADFDVDSAPPSSKREGSDWVLTCVRGAPRRRARASH